MEIRIKEKVYEYTSDFPDGWKFSRGDYFKFPVTIGTNKCFIKRFDKRTETITGWRLLNDLSEKYEPRLARVYFIAADYENKTPVNYVFFEYIEGKTIHELIAKKVSFNLAKLTEGLFAALQTLETRSHWFPDFFEKNMLISNNENFFLIDLDSAQPLKDLPDSEMWGCKDYWALVFRFCKEILHLTDIQPSYFYGASFNYLQALFLILRLKEFSLNDQVEYDEVAFFNKLPQHLNNISPSFKNIFRRVYERRAQPLEPAEINEIKQLIQTEIIPLTADFFKGTGIIAPPEEEAVVIRSFEVMNYPKQQNDTFSIPGGELFTLKWDVQNATQIDLYRNGIYFQQFTGKQNMIDITETLDDGQPKKIEYRLVAGFDLTKVEKALVIEIVPTATTPAINYFRVKDYVEKNEEIYTVQSGRSFILEWDVTHAEKIRLLSNGEPAGEFITNQNSVTLNEEAWDGKERTIEYTLVASRSDELLERVEQTSLRVKLIYQQQDIESFTVKGFLTKNENEYFVESGTPFTLGWDLTKAREMEILKNGLPFKTVPADKNNISLTETVADGAEQKIVYTLVSSATKFSNKSSRSVTVIVQKNAPAVPVIKVFKTNKSVIRQSGSFTLSWDVENASRVGLYKNGIFYKEFPIGETSVELEENFEGTVKHLRFSLLAANDVEAIRSDSVNVDVKPKLNIAKLAGIIIGVLAVAALVYFVVPLRKPTGTAIMNAADFDTVSTGDTITLTGLNIPADTNSVEVKFNDVKANIVRLTKDTIRLVVPKLTPGANLDLTVYMGGKTYAVGKNLQYSESPSMSSPVFNDLSGTVLSQNEVVTLKGQNLPTEPGAIQILMNNVPTKMLQQAPDSIRIIVPDLKEKFVNINAVINGTDIPIAHGLPYRKTETPVITTINPLTVNTLNEGEVVTIFGTNIPRRRSDVKVQFNSTSATVVQQSARSIKVQVPSLDKDVTSVNITVTVKGELFRVGNNIGYQPQQVVIFANSQNKITEGEHFFISGNHIPTAPGTVTVSFNNVKARITEQKANVIQVIIPHLPPNTRQADVVVQVNGKDHKVASNITYQPLRVIVNVCEFGTLSWQSYKRGIIKLGNKHVELTVKNDSKFTMTNIVVAVHYVQKNGDIQTEEFEFQNIPVGESQKKRSEKDIKSATIKLEIKSVTTKEFGEQRCK